MATEYKTGPGYATKATDAGIVETVFAVMGNVDEGGDVIHPGAFSKTFAERGRKVRVLDHHRTGSIMDAIGKPLELRELTRDQLPGDVLARFPDATGGAYAKVQLLMDTEEGRGAFARIKAGAVDEWSFGYDALDADYSKAVKDGAEVTVRNLRSLRLHELSPVLWGMNRATQTISAKAEAEPVEAKPKPEAGESRDDYLARCVPQVMDEGTATDNDQAVAMCSSMYERGKGAPEDAMPETESTSEPERKAGRVIAKRNAERLGRALAELNSVLKDAGLLEIEEPDEEDEPAPAKERAAVEDGEPKAGPVAPPTYKRIALVESLRMQQQQLEVRR